MQTNWHNLESFLVYFNSELSKNNLNCYLNNNFVFSEQKRDTTDSKVDLLSLRSPILVGFRTSKVSVQTTNYARHPITGVEKEVNPERYSSETYPIKLKECRTINERGVSCRVNFLKYKVQPSVFEHTTTLKENVSCRTYMGGVPKNTLK